MLHGFLETDYFPRNSKGNRLYYKRLSANIFIRRQGNLTSNSRNQGCMKVHEFQPWFVFHFAEKINSYSREFCKTRLSEGCLEIKKIVDIKKTAHGGGKHRNCIT